MNGFEKLFRLLQKEVPDLELRNNEPMARHTTFRVGGPAALLAMPVTEQELVSAVKFSRAEGIEPIFIGQGSNLLVDDKGLNSFVIKTAPQMNKCRVDQTRVLAWAGAPLAQIANAAADNSLTGLEFAHGIPGSLGGAVVMNAGAYDGEMRQVVTAVRALNQNCEIEELSADQCEFGYRHSAFSDGKKLVISAVMDLQRGDETVIRTRMNELMVRRKEKQPLEWPSAGSTFKRPAGYFAAALIDQCGLKGFRVGGAQISDKHAGFVINADNASCRDILNLMDEVRARVYRETGVVLEPEVKYLR